MIETNYNKEDKDIETMIGKLKEEVQSLTDDELATIFDELFIPDYCEETVQTKSLNIHEVIEMIKKDIEQTGEDIINQLSSS